MSAKDNQSTTVRLPFANNIRLQTDPSTTAANLTPKT
jgi:hypothetical protein